MEERIYDFWVSTLQDGYIGKLISIVENAGGAYSLYNMKEKELRERLGLSPRMIKHIFAHHIGEEELLDKYRESIRQGICYVNYKDENYPGRLRNIDSRPHGLFYKGTLPDDNIPAVAVIGSRECSEYGRTMAEYFGDRLAKRGINIISGMAWGIDGLAQMAALNAGGNSFGVLGCGVDVVYPRKNQRLYDRLCMGGNCVMSEYAPGSAAASRQFPPRNRIISGLCDVLLVVEARAKSGTLITVDMAIEQGKCVMVVPGRITDDLSAGCLNLIGEGARIATGTESVIDELEGFFAGYDFRQSKKDVCNKVSGGTDPDRLDEKERRVYNCLDYLPVDIGQVSLKTGLDITEISVILTDLEIKELVRECSKGFFVKCIDKAVVL